MGIITLTLISAGLQPLGTGAASSGSSSPARWPSRSAPTRAAGASSAPSARGLTEVKPAQGFAAETSTAATILASSHLGFALSTTQVASGSVIGSGLGRRGSSVRWGDRRPHRHRLAAHPPVRRPSSAAVAALLADLGPIGVVIDVVVGAVVVILTIFWRSRRNRVTSENAVKPVPLQGKSEVAASGTAVGSRRSSR